MGRTRRLRRNFEERGTRIEDGDAGRRARDRVTRQPPLGQPRKLRSTEEATGEATGEATVGAAGKAAGEAAQGHVRPRSRRASIAAKRRTAGRPPPPRAADRQRLAQAAHPPRPRPLPLHLPLPPEAPPPETVPPES